MIQEYTAQVVEVDVSGRPSPTETDKPKEEGQRQKEETLAEVRILVDLCVSNGLHLRQKNLSYGQLKRLVEKLEGLCRASMNSAGSIACWVSMT